MNRTAGVSAVSGTTMWSSQTFSNMFLGVVLKRLPGYGGARGIHVDVIEPAPLVLGATLDERKERRLQFRRDRTAFAVADLDGVHRTDGRDLGGGAGEEQLVRQVKHLA